MQVSITPRGGRAGKEPALGITNRPATLPAPVTQDEPSTAVRSANGAPHAPLARATPADGAVDERPEGGARPEQAPGEAGSDGGGLGTSDRLGLGREVVVFDREATEAVGASRWRLQAGPF